MLSPYFCCMEVYCSYFILFVFNLCFKISPVSLKYTLTVPTDVYDAKTRIHMYSYGKYMNTIQVGVGKSSHDYTILRFINRELRVKIMVLK